MASEYKDLASNKLQNEAFTENLRDLQSSDNITIEQLKNLYAKSKIARVTMSIDEFIQDVSIRLSDLKIYQDQYLSGTKSFADIAISGPKNVSEVALIEAACTMLSPDEMQNAICGRKSVADVFSMIDNSQLKKRTIELVLQRQNQLKEELRQRAEREKEIKSVWRDKVTNAKTQEPNRSLPSRSK